MKNINYFLISWFVLVGIFCKAQTIYSSSGTYTVCEGNFMDPGDTSNYNINQTVVITFFPGTVDSVIMMTFTSFRTEYGYDGLMIYNGPDTNSTLISSGIPTSQYSPITAPQGAWQGTNSPDTITSTHPSGALTFVFKTDSTVVFAGWNAFISCVSPPTIITNSIINSINKKTSDFSVFPNPIINETNIFFDEIQRNITIKLIDITGKEIKSNTFSGMNYSFEKGDITSGIYFVKVVNENKNTIIKKIVFQ